MTTADITSAEIVQLARSCALGSEITSDSLLERFVGQTGWEQQYRQLIQLGKQLPLLPATCKTADRQVHGCESQVWLATGIEDGRLWLLADGDARIVKGLLAVMVAAVNGRTVDEIRKFDWQCYFEQLQLLRHLSPSRGNGLHAIAARIRTLADAAQ